MQFSNSRLLIFAKAPVPGQVKTRLAPALGYTGAALFYRDLLTQTITKFARAELCPVECWCAPDTEHVIFQNASKELGVVLQQQSGADLGERMAYAARETLSEAQAVILIGGDCPVLQPDHLRRVLEWLSADVDAVVGPAEDGGYVLLGLRKFDPLLFEGICWGGDQVLAATQERLERLGWHWRMLETLWDLDRPADLLRYETEFRYHEDALSIPASTD